MIDQLIQLFKDKAEAFGADPTKEFVFRNNTKPESLNDNGAYFGLISPDEESSGTYHDFSIVMFPNVEQKPWLMTLVIGSSGFKNDYELATQPGLRRLFSKLVDGQGFLKSDFSDIDTNLPKSLTKRADLQHLKNTLSRYTKVIVAAQIIDDPLHLESQKRISAFIAAYAFIRGWPSNDLHRKAIAQALSNYNLTDSESDEAQVKRLLLARKFVVLQGAPGTGKTTLAKKIGHEIAQSIYFTQFHAETSYVDFVSGIQPDVENNSLRYVHRDGVFVQAVKYAVANPTHKVILLIDEINRANLASVLGPAFYLFEYQMQATTTKIDLTPNFSIEALPDNFYVMATMNTSDRSLAVVDFALRRRFAWYTLKPKPLSISHFYKKDFDEIDRIFNWYANENELNLQPGQGYFIAADEAAMQNRIRYEIYPLIKEYLFEGLLQHAKEEFNSYFLNRIQQPLFE